MNVHVEQNPPTGAGLCYEQEVAFTTLSLWDVGAAWYYSQLTLINTDGNRQGCHLNLALFNWFWVFLTCL